MSERHDYIQHLENFLELATINNIQYIAICSFVDEKIQVLTEKKYFDNFNYLTNDEIISQKQYTSESDKEVISYELKKDNKIIKCLIYPVFTGIKVTDFIIIEFENELNENGQKILNFFIASTKKIIEIGKSTDPHNNKYKIMLMKMREMQAKLFPSFNDMELYDIKSAYLPADLMSGNFMDAFFLDKSVYQIAICDVGAYDANASFAGASIRTLIRSSSSSRVVPSALITGVITKLSKIFKESTKKINLIVYQININTGITKISSYGKLNTIYYIHSKKASTNLNKTEIGQHLAKRMDGRDIRIQLSENDSLLYFSDGVINITNTQNTANFDEEMVKAEFMQTKEEPSIKITQNLIEKIYFFSDFAPINEDIILLTAKKRTFSEPSTEVPKEDKKQKKE
jgi:phosphoserine phosphatase RsbU/P